MNIAASLPCLWLIAGAAVAGSDPGPAPQSGLTAPAASNHFPARAPGIVATLGGNWSISWETPDGRVIGKGRETWSVATGETVFTEENRSVVNGAPADEYAAMWWDAKAGKIHGIWCDDSINDEGCSSFDVEVRQAGIVLSGEWELQGKRQAWREVFTISQGELTQKLYVGDPGTEPKLAGLIRGKRI